MSNDRAGFLWRSNVAIVRALFTLGTFGLYFFYWFVMFARHLRSYGRTSVHPAINLILVFCPVLGAVVVGRLIHAAAASGALETKRIAGLTLAQLAGTSILLAQLLVLPSGLLLTDVLFNIGVSAEVVVLAPFFFAIILVAFCVYIGQSLQQNVVFLESHLGRFDTFLAVLVALVAIRILLVQAR